MTRVVSAVDVSSWTTDAKVRSFCQAIETALSGCGLVQTADTGQINTSTITHPGSTATLLGYQIWRFNDSLQGTAPIYLRVHYYTGSHASGASPNVRITVGQGTNGSGTLTGLLTPQFVGLGGTYIQTSVATNTAMKILATHTDGYFMIFTDTISATVSNTNQNAIWFIMDRTRNQTTGAPTSEGVSMWNSAPLGSGGSTPAVMSHHVLNFATGYTQNINISTSQNNYIINHPPADLSSYPGKLFPVYTLMPRPLVSVGLVGCMEDDVAEYATFTCKPIGTSTTRTYICVTNNSNSSNNYIGTAGNNQANATNVNVACLWED